VTLAGGRILVVLSGIVTGPDILYVASRGAELERACTRAPDRLADFSGISGASIGFDDISQFASSRRAMRLANDIKTAIAASTALQQGYARMFQTLNGRPQITVRVFSTIEDAEAWLTGPHTETR
jgi:hypothetical protein